MTNEKTQGLKLKAIYANAITGELCRLTEIIPSQGICLENARDIAMGEMRGDIVPPEAATIASWEEVQLFLETFRDYRDSINNGE